jgi:hypothetical protein
MLASMGHGGYGTILFFGSTCAVMFVFAWFCIPETKVRKIA